MNRSVVSRASFVGRYPYHDNPISVSFPCPMDERLTQASPVVVIGMHRSGTRLAAQILERLGVFMGADQQGDSESVTFMLINEGILHQCSAFWSEPMSAHFALSQPEIAENLAASTRQTLTARFGAFVGQSGWRPASKPEESRPFGWKDPRNTFTLPVWKQIFPHLRVLHIVRHGVDVAASLARRHAAALREATGEPVPAALTVIRDHALGVLSSRRGWTLAEALTMWEQYVEKARVEMAELKGRALEIRFEDLLGRPADVVPDIARLCGTTTTAYDPSVYRDLATGRAFAYKRDTDLAAFADTARKVLERHGYSP